MQIFWVAARLFNKLVSRKLWCPISLLEPFLQHFWGHVWDLEAALSPPCHQHSVSSSLGRLPLPGTTRCVDLRRGCLSPGEPRRWVSVTQRILGRPGHQLGSPAYHTGKNLGLNLSLPQSGRRGAWSTLSRDTCPVSQIQRVRWNYCTVWECVKVWAWDMAQLWSLHPQVPSSLIWSRVSHNRASGLGII
jgi:hypothetical protein